MYANSIPYAIDHSMTLHLSEISLSRRRNAFTLDLLKIFNLLFVVVNLLNVFSRVEQGYRTAHRSLLAQTQLVFKVRVQSDAKLALLIVPGNYKTASYEFEIGVNGNTKSILRIKSATGDLVTEVDTPSILSESELRPFWISWHNATIRFGTGESVGQGQLLSQTDPQPAYRRHVHSVAVASGAVVNGEWEFKGTLDDGENFGGTLNDSVSLDRILF